MAGEIFISYRRADRDKAEQLYRLLQQRGVEAWYDAHLAAGEDWRTSTAGALERADIFVLLFSKSASESDDIIKELAAATFEKKLVVPVRVENVRPKGAFLYELASRNWVDAFEDTEAQLSRLADQLAAIVKGGPAAMAAAAALGSPIQAPKPLWKQPAALGAAVVAIVLSVGATALFLSSNPTPAPTPPAPPAADLQRVAFFGFTPADDDPVTKTIAVTATDAAFSNFGVRRIDTVARAEAVVAGGQARLARAQTLGARYVISGEVRRDGEKAHVAMRLEDAPSRSTLWEQTLDGEAAAPAQLGLSAADRIVDMTGCISQSAYTDEAGPRTAEALSLSAAACTALLVNGAGAGVSGIPRYTALLSELAQKGLGGPDTDGALAFFSAMTAGLAPPSQRSTLSKQANEALDRAMKTRPDSFATIAARADLELDRSPPAAWMPAVEQGLQRTPKSAEVYWYAHAARLAGFELLALGRVQDASRYFKAAFDADPLNRQAEVFFASTVAMTGSIPVGELRSWDEEMADLLRSRPEDWAWEQALATAVLYRRGDAEKLFALAPSTLPAFIVPCYRGVQAGLKQSNKAARLAAARKARACLTEFDSPQIIVQMASALGDLDAAFALIDTPEAAKRLLRVYYAPWFTPATKALRADPRFLPLMQKLGYVEYWTKTQTRPDVCETAEERDIPLCRALH